MLRDEALVVGPSRQQQIVCVECLRPCDGSVTCQECKLPLCGQTHPDSQWHRSIECPFLKEQGFKAASVGQKNGEAATDLPTLLVQLACVTPLRLLLRGLRGDKSYQDLNDNLYDFYSTAAVTSKTQALEEDMVATMWNKFGLKYYLASEDIVHCAIGQLFNNAKVIY